MTRRRSKRPPALVLAADTGSRLLLASPGDVSADDNARTITGLVVPYGPTGHTSGGRLKFSKGSLSVSDPKRVKLLREHDQHDVIGHGVSFEETDAGLVGTFRVPAGENGDRALTEASEGLRDAFSVGVQLDDATLQRLQRARGAAVDARGALREVSQVSVPAFDDARVAAGAGDLVVSSWTTTTPPTPSAAGAGTTHQEGNTMTEEQRRRLRELLATASDQRTDEQRTELGELLQAAATAGELATFAGTTTGTPQQPATVPAGQANAGTPAVVPAVAGAAHVVSEPSTYTFDGGASIVRDLYNAHMRHDTEAAERVERFNAQLAGGNPASVDAFVQAAATRDDVDGAGTDLPPSFGGGTRYRPDLMRALVDVKRPIISRLSRLPISDPTPFAIPTVGEFTGVGDHTEGTPHRPAGTLTLGTGDVVTPKATSGAWEVSRELLDSANPVLDRIATRAMLRDYQRQTEGKAVALINAVAADAAANVYGVSTPLALRGAMMDFVNDDDEPADLVGVSKALLRTLGLDTDTTDRPQLPFVGPVNAQGTIRAGYTGVAIDGVEMFRAARLDAGVTGANVAGGVGFLARSEGLMWAESNVLQFRFDEVLGPGVVKLALWAYNAAAVLDTADVAVINSGADPTP
jgi:HK97 family phage prohead protease